MGSMGKNTKLDTWWGQGDSHSKRFQLKTKTDKKQKKDIGISLKVTDQASLPPFGTLGFMAFTQREQGEEV